MLYGSLELFLINFSKHFREYIRTENLRYKIVWDYSKNNLNANIFCFCKFFKKFLFEYIRTENPKLKNLKVT